MKFILTALVATTGAAFTQDTNVPWNLQNDRFEGDACTYKKVCNPSDNKEEWEKVTKSNEWGLYYYCYDCDWSENDKNGSGFYLDDATAQSKYSSLEADL